MRKVDAEMHRIMPEVDAARIGPLGSITLQRLSTIAPVPVNVLVEAMGRDASQMSRVIGRLEVKGLICRHPHKVDGRVSVLDLTAAGAAQVQRLEAALRTVIGEIFEPLTKREHETLLKLLVRLSA